MSILLWIRLYRRVVMFLLLYLMADSLRGMAWLVAMPTSGSLQCSAFSRLGAVNEAFVQPVLHFKVWLPLAVRFMDLRTASYRPAGLTIRLQWFGLMSGVVAPLVSKVGRSVSLLL